MTAFIAIVIIMCGVGYLANIVRMFAGFGKAGSHVIMRLVGIFLPPIGVIAGFIPNPKVPMAPK